jgi:hypothetical protein
LIFLLSLARSSAVSALGNPYAVEAARLGVHRTERAFLSDLQRRDGGTGVTLINTDGMSFVGPGSEWFWTAVSGIVLAVTFIAIYRQLRLTRDGEAIRMLDSFYAEWNSERMVRYRLDVTRWIAAGHVAGTQPRGSLNGIGNFWEKLGTLGRRGHLDTLLLWDGFGADCVAAWYDLDQFVQAARNELVDPRIFEHFEWLAGRMNELDRRSGSEPMSRERYASLLEARLAAQEENLRVEVALRSTD